MITHAFAILPIRNPSRFPIQDLSLEDERLYQENLYIYLDQLAHVIPMIDCNISVDSIEMYVPDEELLQLLNVDNKLLAPYLHDYVKISVSYKNDVAKMRMNNPHYKDRSTEELLFGSAAAMLSQCIERVYLVSEISFPGVLDIYPGIAFEVDGPRIAINRKHTFNFLTETKYRELGSWPNISNMNLGDVATWCHKIGFGIGHYARSPVQRAVAGYGHVISLGLFKQGECLFRIMQGLEAFYTRGAGDLRSQLTEKSKLFLDGQKLETNLVGKLYDMRSKFIHGAALFDYPSEFGVQDGSEGRDEDKKIQQFSDAVEFGLCLLLASIQKCVRGSIHEVHWEYAYSIEAEASR